MYTLQPGDSEQALESQTDWAQILASALTNCVTVGKSFKLSEMFFSSVNRRYNIFLAVLG